MHDDPLQGILFARPALVDLGSQPAKRNIIGKILAVAGLQNMWGRPVKATHVTVQFMAGDQYIDNPGALLARFRTPDDTVVSEHRCA